MRFYSGKLDNMGIRGVAKMWFQSYLTNITQFVQIHDITSTSQHINCGVPQGSILGPLLFLIYINDIKNSTELTLLCFADDTTVSFSSSHPETVYATMNTHLDMLKSMVWGK